MECDVLFLGYGPISHAFAKKLTANGQKVIAVTQIQTDDTTTAEFPEDSFQTTNWIDVQRSQIRCESTYVCWRQSPRDRVFGPEIIDWVKSVNLKTDKIHHLSSASVYSGEQLFFSESDYDFHKSSTPLNAKQELEELVLAISQVKQSDFVNYRISNVFGAGLSHGFINESIENIRNGRPIRIFKNLDIIRDYLLINDLIDAFFNLRLHNSSDKVFNISTGFGVAISEVIEHLEISWGKDLKFLEIEAPKHTLPRSVLSCKNLEKTIPWKPQLLGESLARVSKTQSLRITSLNSDERINNRNGWIDD